MTFCKIFGIALAATLCTVITISLMNILGHGVLAIASPSVYTATLRSAPFVGPAGCVPFIVFHLCHNFTEIRASLKAEDRHKEITNEPRLTLDANFWDIVNFLLHCVDSAGGQALNGVIFNVIGVAMLRHSHLRDYLPSLNHAARVGATAEVLGWCVRLWRLIDLEDDRPKLFPKGWIDGGQTEGGTTAVGKVDPEKRKIGKEAELAPPRYGEV